MESAASDNELQAVVIERPVFERRRVHTLLTRDDAAELLKVSTDTVDRLVRAGGLSFVRVGAQVRFTIADMEAFIAGNRQEAT
jgi:excisionase family DNA binding protein